MKLNNILLILLLILLLIILLILLCVFTFNKNNIYNHDLKYFSKKIYKKIKGQHIIDNKNDVVNGGVNGVVNEKINEKINKDRILIITCDNRPELDFVKLHNKSFEKYVKIHSDVDYKFYTDCGKENIYWSRLFLIRNLMLQNKYRWIGWVDSDTMVIDYDFDIKDYLYNKQSANMHITIADDNRPYKVGINSGIFFIKNSEIGFNFIVDVINQYKLNKDCRDLSNNIIGMFAGVCYEQAQMELQIQNKYKNNTNIISKNIVICTKDDISYKTDALPFIYHLIATKTEKRNEIFKKLINKI